MFMDKKFVKMRDNIEIFTQIKETSSPVWIIATHGIGEHSGRHQYIPELFGHDFNILQYDLRGHGKSTGKRVYVADFSDYMKDLGELIDFLKEKFRMNRYILFGHSMGALITSSFMQNFVKENLYPERVIINAAPCGASGVLGQVLKILPQHFINKTCEIPYSFLIPGLVNLNYLSHDPSTIVKYKEDQLNFLKLESKLIFELIKCAQSTFSRPLRSKCPSYVTVGSEDKVVGASELVHYFTHVDKSFQLKVFEGAFHEIHNEVAKFKKPYLAHLKLIFEEVLFS